MSEQYDDSNKGAVWNCAAHSGKANVQGTQYFADLVPTNAKSPDAPAATLYLRDRQKFHVIALFKPKQAAKYILSGKSDELGVRAFVYACDNLSPNSPVYRFSFLDLDDQRPAKEQERAAEPAANHDDPPF